MNIICYENIVFYKNNFYTDTEWENIKVVQLDNRLHKPFKPVKETFKRKEEFEKFDKIVLLLDHFHWNPAHMMWDFIYPSWYGFFYKDINLAKKSDFLWLTKSSLTDIHNRKFINMYQIFSGVPISSTNIFSKKYNKPIIIPKLITGLENIGIGNIYKNNLCVKIGLEIDNIDPIQMFVNRWYNRYNIKRNSLLTDIDKCKNIIYIKNKRPYHGIEELFIKMNNRYSNKYNFKIIDYSKYNFKEQLEILNNTCLCIVGVGSARFNTPFLPNGAIEIQTFQPNVHRKNFMEYVDYHAGTISKYIKVKNIPFYTKEEAMNNKYSYLLEKYIDEALNKIPCKIPIKLEDNIPKEILNLRNHKNYNNKFDIWRSKLSNRVDELINML